MFFTKVFNKFVKVLKDKDYRFVILSNLGLNKNLSSEEFLTKMYRIQTGQPLNLDNPLLYTEKLQWLKLYDHRPEYSRLVDKYEVKKYIAEKIGQEYVIPLLGVWERVEDIDFDKLPQQFVLKTTHDSGGIVVCKDKNKLNIEETKRKLRYCLNRDYYIQNREWPYKNVPHRIIAEQYMEDSKQGELRDYKFFTFNGEPKVFYIAQGRGKNEETVADFFDMDFNHLPFTIDHDMSPVLPEKPKNFELMKQLAAKLSEGTPQLRVDFYEVDGKVYFGEMTFFHCSGMVLIKPEEWNKRLGDWVILPQIQSKEQICV